MSGHRAEVLIPSHGEQLAAYLYLPVPPGESVPCVVMAHGFSATRDDGPPSYAEVFHIPQRRARCTKSAAAERNSPTELSALPNPARV